MAVATVQPYAMNAETHSRESARREIHIPAHAVLLERELVIPARDEMNLMHDAARET